MEPKMILDRILITEEEIRERVAAIAAQIDAKYHERGELVLLCALKGAYVFTADLSRKIQTPHSVEFIQAASYGNNTQSSGNVQLRETMSEDLAGKNILLVEDIYDRGLTLHRLVQHLREKKPESIEVCCFLVKDTKREKETQINYYAFEVADLFVVGYGLDYAQKMRNLPYVGVMAPA